VAASKDEIREVFSAIALIVIVIAAVIGMPMYLYPKYEIYRQRSAGEATLAHSQSAKEVAVSEARAKMEAAEFLSKAEIIRAEGVAKANKIIGDSLKENEAYLRYLWIQTLETTNPTVVYVPTEAGLPILEAGKRPVVPVAKAENEPGAGETPAN